MLEKSWTIGGNYEIVTANAGTFDIRTNGSIFDSFKFQGLPGQAYIQYAGNATNAGVFGGTLPKYHFYTTLSWNYRDMDYVIGNTYLSGVTDTGPNGVSPPQPVSRYSTWDLRAAYDWHFDSAKDVKLAAGINNVTNHMPPLAPRTFTDNNADVSTYSPLGRLIYASLSVSF